MYNVQKPSIGFWTKAITWHTLNAYHSVTRQLMFIFNNVPNARCSICISNALCVHLMIPVKPITCKFHVWIPCFALIIFRYMFNCGVRFFIIENESCINSNYISETVLLLRTGHVSYFSVVFFFAFYLLAIFFMIFNSIFIAWTSFRYCIWILSIIKCRWTFIIWQITEIRIFNWMQTKFYQKKGPKELHIIIMILVFFGCAKI